jgi:hypothetical protein
MVGKLQQGDIDQQGLYCKLSYTQYIVLYIFKELLTCSVWLFSTDLSNCTCVTVMDVKL